MGTSDKSFRSKKETSKKIEHLTQALKDEDENIRREAAEVLGEIGNERAEKPLKQALKDENRYVQEVAKTALKKIKTKKEN